MGGCLAPTECGTKSADTERDYSANFQCNVNQLSIAKAKTATANIVRGDIESLGKKIEAGDATLATNNGLSAQRVQDHENAIAALREIDGKINAETGEITGLLEKEHVRVLHKLHDPEVDDFVELMSKQSKDSGV